VHNHYIDNATPKDSKMNTRANTTAVICENTEGYFVAFLNNGGVRVGLRDNECFDFPEDHPEFSRAVKLTVDTVESAYDEYFGLYRCA
jgi:hypothetical protein